MAIYTNAYLYIRGELLAENTTAEVTLEHASQDFFSIQNGYEGTDIGPSVRVVSFDVVVPVGTQTIDYELHMLDKTMLELRVEEAGSKGRVAVSRGRIVGVRRSAGVGRTYTLSITFKGTVTPFR